MVHNRAHNLYSFEQLLLIGLFLGNQPSYGYMNHESFNGLSWELSQSLFMSLILHLDISLILTHYTFRNNDVYDEKAFYDLDPDSDKGK